MSIEAKNLLSKDGLGILEAIDGDDVLLFFTGI